MAVEHVFTLRIVFSGLLAFGPLQPLGKDTGEMWALAIENDDHRAELRVGCDSEGVFCGGSPVDITNMDLEILVNDTSLEADSITIDKTFTKHVARMGELFASPMVYANLIKTGKLMANADRVHARMTLRSGNEDENEFVRDARLSAHKVDACNSWRFKRSDGFVLPDYEPHLADRVQFQLQIVKPMGEDDPKVELLLFNHLTEAKNKILVEKPKDGRVVEIWVINNATSGAGDPKHFMHQYSVYSNPPTGKEFLPEAVQVSCNGAPDIGSIACPSTRFP